MREREWESVRVEGKLIASDSGRKSVTKLSDAFQGSEKKHMVPNDRPSKVCVRIPAHQKRSVLPWDVGGIECVVAMEGGNQPVPLVSPASSHDVHRSARALSEFRFVTRRERLKFQNRILIEGRCRSAINTVAVRHAVNKKKGVPSALSQDRCRCVGTRIFLPVDRDAGNQLHEVEIVPPINGHLLNLLRQNGGAG